MLAVYWASHKAGLLFFASFLGLWVQTGVTAIIVIFQKEIRMILLWLGGMVIWHDNKLVAHLLNLRAHRRRDVDITPVVDAVKVLAGSSTGALIILSRREPLRSFQESGESIDATISKRLLLAIFNKTSPLHDGAVIIHNNKVAAARCILPVTERQGVPAHLGLRHRSAIGISEVTDVLVVVVSEETGQVAIAQRGILNINLSMQEIRAAIYRYLQVRPGGI